MKSLITTYLFLSLILASIVTPTYFALEENMTEISISEVNEDEGKESNTTEFDEIKLFQTSNTTHFKNYAILENDISFSIKYYTSKIQNLESPPPEFLS